MSKEAETGATAPGFRLQKERPSKFEPVEIVYTRYTIDRTKPEGEQVVPELGSQVVRGMTIEEFIDWRVHGRLPPADDVYHQASDDSAEARPINIYVSDQCWVVIELDDKEKWQFRPGAPGITTRDDHKDDNWGLMHLMPLGKFADGEGSTGDGCRLIWFGVNARCKNEHQRFICNVDRLPAGLRDDPIEPDIPNDGGKFPFPLYGKPCPEDAE